MSDEAAQEVIGFIFTFLFASVVMMLSMQTFLQTKDSNELLQAAVEFDLVGERVASQMTQASQVAQAYPNATYERVFRLPTANRDYFVNLSRDSVFVNSTDGRVSANATLFRAGALADIAIGGHVTVAGGMAKVCYSTDAQGKHLRLVGAGETCT